MNYLDRPLVDKRINEFFILSQSYLGEEFLKILDHFKVDPNRSHFSRLPLGKLIPILNELNVTLESVIEGKVDFEVMKSQALKDNVLPEKYLSKLPYSKRFTGYYMLDYINRCFGPHSRLLFMQSFQLKKEHFTDYADNNNILLSIDITNKILDYFGEDCVISMGMNSMTHYKKTLHGQELSGLSCVCEMFEKFFYDFAPFTVEKNYKWSILKSHHKGVLLEGRPHEDVFEAFRSDILKSQSMEFLRKGFFTALPELISGFRGEVNQLKSLSLGDGRDLYEISFFKKPSLATVHYLN